MWYIWDDKTGCSTSLGSLRTRERPDEALEGGRVHPLLGVTTDRAVFSVSGVSSILEHIGTYGTYRQLGRNGVR